MIDCFVFFAPGGHLGCTVCMTDSTNGKAAWNVRERSLLHCVTAVWLIHNATRGKSQRSAKLYIHTKIFNGEPFMAIADAPQLLKCHKCCLFKENGEREFLVQNLSWFNLAMRLIYKATIVWRFFLTNGDITKTTLFYTPTYVD